jgi:hypothetical protein
MTVELTIDRKFHVTRQHLGRKKLREGSPTKRPIGRIPRVARVMALAILFLPRVESGSDPIREIDVRRLAQVLDWGEQRRLCE